MTPSSPNDENYTNMRDAARALSIPSTPWWIVLALDMLAAVVAAVLVRQGIIAIDQVPWHMAAVIGVAAAEFCSAIVDLLLTLRWKASLRRHESRWPVAAYSQFNQYLADSHSPLDNNNVNAAAAMVGDIVEKQGWSAHVWHASVGMLLTVPACLSVLELASRRLGDNLDRFSEYLAPLGVVVGASTLTLVCSLLVMMARRSGLAAWKTSVCDQRATDINRRVAEVTPSEARERDDVTNQFAKERPTRDTDSPDTTTAETDSVEQEDAGGFEDYENDWDDSPPRVDPWNVADQADIQEDNHASGSQTDRTESKFEQQLRTGRVESSEETEAELEPQDYFDNDATATEPSSRPRRKRDSSHWDV